MIENWFKEKSSRATACPKEDKRLVVERRLLAWLRKEIAVK
jgi:uncharacterized membrane protein YidH (DUF202 family)